MLCWLWLRRRPSGSNNSSPTYAAELHQQAIVNVLPAGTVSTPNSSASSSAAGTPDGQAAAGSSSSIAHAVHARTSRSSGERRPGSAGKAAAANGHSHSGAPGSPSASGLGLGSHSESIIAPGSGGGAAGQRELLRVSSTVPGHSHSLSGVVDVVDLKRQHDGLHDESVGQEDVGFAKHAIVVLLVLGAALASAICLPNVEFIFGLTGES